MPKRVAFPPPLVESHIDALFHDDLHAKRIRSLADGALGVLQSGALGIHAIGRGLAAAHGLLDKHAIKQMDRLVGNAGIETASLLRSWAAHVIAARSTPLAWMTVVKSKLAAMRNDHEDELLVRLHRALPPGVHVTVVADRGFADHKLYAFLKEELGFDYIIRFRSVIHVANDKGETRKAKGWLGPSGRIRVPRNASVTAKHYPVPTVVCVQEKGMNDAWCIVASDAELAGKNVVQLYGRRFSIEEMFRACPGTRWARRRDGIGCSSSQRSLMGCSRCSRCSALPERALAWTGCSRPTPSRRARFRCFARA